MDIYQSINIKSVLFNEGQFPLSVLNSIHRFDTVDSLPYHNQKEVEGLQDQGVHWWKNKQD